MQIEFLPLIFCAFLGKFGDFFSFTRYHFLFVGALLILVGVILMVVKCVWFRIPIPMIDLVTTPTDAADAAVDIFINPEKDLVLPAAKRTSPSSISLHAHLRNGVSGTGFRLDPETRAATAAGVSPITEFRKGSLGGGGADRNRLVNLENSRDLVVSALKSRRAGPTFTSAVVSSPSPPVDKRHGKEKGKTPPGGGEGKRVV